MLGKPYCISITHSSYEDNKKFSTGNIMRYVRGKECHCRQNSGVDIDGWKAASNTVKKHVLNYSAADLKSNMPTTTPLYPHNRLLIEFLCHFRVSGSHSEQSTFLQSSCGGKLSTS